MVQNQWRVKLWRLSTNQGSSNSNCMSHHLHRALAVKQIKMKQASLIQGCPWWSNKIISIKSQHLNPLKTILSYKIAKVLQVEVWWSSWGKAFAWLNCELNYLCASLNIIFLERMRKRQIMFSYTWAFGHLFLKCDGTVISKENNRQYVLSSHKSRYIQLRS